MLTLERALTEEEVRAILSHGYGILNDIEPHTLLEKSLFTVDELTGIIQAAARMRPAGITDMEVRDVAAICIEAMKEYADELQLGAK